MHFKESNKFQVWEHCSFELSQGSLFKNDVVCYWLEEKSRLWAVFGVISKIVWFQALLSFDGVSCDGVALSALAVTVDNQV